MGCPMPNRQMRNLYINPTLIDTDPKSQKIMFAIRKIQSIGMIIDTNYSRTDQLIFIMWSDHFPDLPPGKSIESYETIYDFSTSLVGMRLNKTTVPFDFFVPTYGGTFNNGVVGTVQNNNPNVPQKSNQPKYPMSKGFVADQVVMKPDKKWAT